MTWLLPALHFYAVATPIALLAIYIALKNAPYDEDE